MTGMSEKLKRYRKTPQRSIDLPAGGRTRLRGYRSRADSLTNAIDTFLEMGPIDQAHEIRHGFAVDVIRNVSDELLHVSLRILLRSLGLSNSSIGRKSSTTKRLGSTGSDRIARAILIHALAKDVLEDPKLAGEWMLKPNVHLHDETPLDMLDTQVGYDCVRDVLIRLAHGVCA